MRNVIIATILVLLLLPAVTSDSTLHVTSAAANRAQTEQLLRKAKKAVEEAKEIKNSALGLLEDMERDLAFQRRVIHNLRETLRGCAATVGSLQTKIEDLSRENQHQQLSVRKMLGRLNANYACHRS